VVEVISDKNKVVISVTDFYGTLTEKEIFDFITKGEITEKQGGAGIGIYLIFKFAHKLIINIEHKKYTEFLIVIERDKRFKWFTSKEKSFHLFQN
jgi:sigma-B regulation protein RsbU (phosphoserine phosphatase)